MPVSCFQGPPGLDGLDGKDGKPGFRVRHCAGEGPRSPGDPAEGTEVAPTSVRGSPCLPSVCLSLHPPPWVSLFLVALASLAELGLTKVRTVK